MLRPVRSWSDWSLIRRVGAEPWPGAIDRLGFSAERLRREYPALVGHLDLRLRRRRSYESRKAFDLLLQGETGVHRHHR